jgi:pimeloyl-ACP methyl ester carboxylesterase
MAPTGPRPAAELDVVHGEINGLAFAWLEAGDPDAPLALCLHGFPDTPQGWRWLLPELADAGFHAVAPFARGYAPTAVPANGVSDIGGWVADGLAFHDRFAGDQPAVVIGHDWGALATYGIANVEPQRWRRVVVMSIPPLEIIGSRMFDFEQVHAFWYQYVFLQPTAEAIVGHDDLVFLDRLWRLWSPGFDPRAEIGRVKDALREPANLTAALSTYRTMLGGAPPPPEHAVQMAAVFGRLTQPTLYLHGADDGCFLFADLGEALDALPVGSRAELIADAGHFLQYEQPDVVDELIVDFVRQ